MSIFVLIAGFISKILGLFGSTFLGPLLGYLNNRETQYTGRVAIFFDALKTGVQGEVDMAAIKSKERVALWGDFWYKALVILIVAPPAFYAAAVFADSIFHFPFDIDAAPERFEVLGFELMKAFIYGGSFMGGIIGAARAFIRK